MSRKDLAALGLHQGPVVRYRFGVWEKMLRSVAIGKVSGKWQDQDSGGDDMTGFDSVLLAKGCKILAVGIWKH